jgi:hypothetical protein
MKTNALFMGEFKDAAARFAEPLWSASQASLAATEVWLQRMPEFMTWLKKYHINLPNLELPTRQFSRQMFSNLKLSNFNLRELGLPDLRLEKLNLGDLHLPKLNLTSIPSNWKTAIMIPNALLHSAMISLNLMPLPPANPFAEGRTLILPSTAESTEEEKIEEVLPENSFFIQPIGHKKKPGPIADPFSNIRFNDRF